MTAPARQLDDLELPPVERAAGPRPVRDPDPAPTAERSLLGALLVGADPEPVFRLLEVSDFEHAPHRAIFAALAAVHERGLPLDAAPLLEELRQSARYEAAGGHTYVAGLIQGMPRSAHAEHYARLVREKAQDRRAALQAAAVRTALQAGDRARAREHLEALTAAVEVRHEVRAARLHAGEVASDPPAATVEGLIPRRGLTLIWSPPSAGKTYLVLTLVHQLIARDPEPVLFGHPNLKIRRPWSRVLWISAEETAGRLQHRAERVCAGLGNPELAGEIRHVWAVAPRRRVTLADLPELVDRYEPDAVIVDPLTAVRPRDVDGYRVSWDLDNDAGTEACVALRGLAAAAGVDLVLVHHSAKDGQQFRGATAWWASVDAMAGLLPDNGRTKLLPQKNRDGRLLPPCFLSLDFTADAVAVRYDGEARGEKLTPTAEKVVAYLNGVGAAPQFKIAENVGAHRETVGRALQQLQEAGLVRPTGEKDRRSPVYERVDQLMGSVGVGDPTDE